MLKHQIRNYNPYKSSRSKTQLEIRTSNFEAPKNKWEKKVWTSDNGTFALFKRIATLRQCISTLGVIQMPANRLAVVIVEQFKKIIGVQFVEADTLQAALGNRWFALFSYSAVTAKAISTKLQLNSKVQYQSILMQLLVLELKVKKHVRQEFDSLAI